MKPAAPPLTAAGTPYDARAARSVLIILAVMALMVTYVETMVIPAFEAFVTFFNDAPASTVVWIISAYLLVGTVATPIFGKLGDKYGKKRMLVLVMALYAVAVSLAGFSPNIGAAFGIDRTNQIYVLIGVRAFQGLGMGMFPLAFAMIPEVFPAARVGQAQGIVSAMFAAGASLGLVGGRLHRLPVRLAAHLPHSDPGRDRRSRSSRTSSSGSRRTLTPKPIDLPGIGSLGLRARDAMFGITEGTYWGWTNFSAVSFARDPVGRPAVLPPRARRRRFLPRTGSPGRRTRSSRSAALKKRNIWISNVNGVIVGRRDVPHLRRAHHPRRGPVPAGLRPDGVPDGPGRGPLARLACSRSPRSGADGSSAQGPKPVMLTGFAVMGLGALGLASVPRPDPASWSCSRSRRWSGTSRC